jgi:outer membrane protein TolC
VDLNADSTNLILELTAYRNVKANLNRLLGIDPEQPFEVTDTINLSYTYRYDSLLVKLHSQNTSLLIARENKDLSVLGLKDARSGRYPQIDFSAGYGYNQSRSQTGFLEYNRSYGPFFGFSATYNIFTGFAVDRAIKNAKILVNSGEIAMKDTLSAIRTEFYQLYNNYMANLSLVRLQLTNQDAARENVDIAFEKYRLGSINDIELRETQKKFIDAQYQLILSQFQAKQAEVELLRISGELYRTLK